MRKQHQMFVHTFLFPFYQSDYEPDCDALSTIMTNIPSRHLEIMKSFNPSFL